MQILHDAFAIKPPVNRVLEHPDSPVKQLPFPGTHLIGMHLVLPGNLRSRTILPSSLKSNLRFERRTMIPTLHRHKTPLSRAYRLHHRGCPTSGDQRFDPGDGSAVQDLAEADCAAGSLSYAYTAVDSVIAVFSVEDGLGQSVSAEHQIEVDRKSTRLNSSHVAISYAVLRLQ